MLMRKVKKLKQYAKKRFIKAFKRFGLLFGYSKHDFYPHHRLKFPSLKARFLRDTSRSWAKNLLSLSSQHFEGVLILGNGPSFNQLSASQFDEFKKARWLTIGLNRSILRFITDILIWADIQTLDDLVKAPFIRSPSSKNMIVLQAVHPKKAKSQTMIECWKKSQHFNNFQGAKLFLLRTVLTSALHLAVKLKIRQVLLCGVDMDNREYFYANSKFNKREPYEQRSQKLINREFGGYTTTSIIAEILNSMAKAGHEIGYLGNSQFLAGQSSVRRLDTEEKISEFLQPAGHPGGTPRRNSFSATDCNVEAASKL